MCIVCLLFSHYDVNPPCLASIQINSRMEFVHQLTQKRILTFIRFSAYRTWIGTIPNCGKRGYSETQFRHKKHQKRLSKMRDMQIRNSDIITELALRKLTRTQKMRKEEQDRCHKQWCLISLEDRHKNWAILDKIKWFKEEP